VSYFVYRIENQDTLSAYIGITNNLTNRKYQHFNKLKKGVSDCTGLQCATNKYGLDVFEFQPLAETEDKDTAIELEKSLIAWYKHLGKSYNISPGGESYGHWGGKKLTDEHKQKISESMKAAGIKRDAKGKNNNFFGKQHSEESRRKISESQIGVKQSRETVLKRAASLSKTLQSEEHKKRLAEQHSKTWIVEDANGKVEIVTNLKDWCSERGVYYQSAYRVARGERTHTKGYKFKLLER